MAVGVNCGAVFLSVQRVSLDTYGRLKRFGLIVQECSSSLHHHADHGAGEIACGEAERMPVGSVGRSAGLLPKALIDLGIDPYQSSKKWYLNIIQWLEMNKLHRRNNQYATTNHAHWQRIINALMNIFACFSFFVHPLVSIIVHVFSTQTPAHLKAVDLIPGIFQWYSL